MWVVLKKVDSDRVATAALHGNLWKIWPSGREMESGDVRVVFRLCVRHQLRITRTVAQAAFRRDSWTGRTTGTYLHAIRTSTV